MSQPEFYVREWVDERTGEDRKEVYFRMELKDGACDHKARDEDKELYPRAWRAFLATEQPAPAPAEAVTELAVEPSEDAPKKSKKKGLFGKSE